MEQSKSLFPNRLRHFRRTFGYKQKEVALLIGVANPTAIADWEKGRTLPHIRNLFNLCALYHTTPEHLYHELMIDCTTRIAAQEYKHFRQTA